MLTLCANEMQIEGRGNGIKINVVNNVDIAKALERPPECMLLVCLTVVEFVLKGVQMSEQQVILFTLSTYSHVQM